MYKTLHYHQIDISNCGCCMCNSIDSIEMQINIEKCKRTYNLDDVNISELGKREETQKSQYKSTKKLQNKWNNSPYVSVFFSSRLWFWKWMMEYHPFRERREKKKKLKSKTNDIERKYIMSFDACGDWRAECSIVRLCSILHWLTTNEKKERAHSLITLLKSKAWNVKGKWLSEHMCEREQISISLAFHLTVVDSVSY